MKNKLWLLTQDVNKGYDTTDSKVVCAETEEEAKNLSIEKYNDDWASFNDIKAVLIGIADESCKKGIVLTSFNAG